MQAPQGACLTMYWGLQRGEQAFAACRSAVSKPSVNRSYTLPRESWGLWIPAFSTGPDTGNLDPVYYALF